MRVYYLISCCVERLAVSESWVRLFNTNHLTTKIDQNRKINYKYACLMLLEERKYLI